MHYTLLFLYFKKPCHLTISPFAPETMEKLRVALNLNIDIYSIDNLGIALSDHQVGEQVEFFSCPRRLVTYSNN